MGTGCLPCCGDRRRETRSIKDFHPSSFYDFSCTTIDGAQFDLAQLKGKVCVITNVATYWGKTPSHYEGMVNLSKQFASGGLIVLAFPCNQFMFQEARGPAAIDAFARARGFVPPDMMMMGKINVVDGFSGGAEPLFKFLQQQTGARVKWNFGAYFLVSRTGEVSGFEHVAPQRLEKDIDILLGAE